jgi:hypothetical protein
VGPTDTVFWGGIPGAFFTPLVSDEEFDAHVKRTIEVMRRSPRYVLGVADQVPPNGLEAGTPREGTRGKVRQIRSVSERQKRKPANAGFLF